MYIDILIIVVIDYVSVIFSDILIDFNRFIN